MKSTTIKAIAVGVIEEYKTRDPFLLADTIGLNILFHDLPAAVDAYRLKNILVLNKNLDQENQKWILAHEIGHYFLHGPNETLANYLKNPLLIKSKIEKEADIFASELLLADIENYRIEGLSAAQLSALFSVPEKYVEYKFKKQEV